MSKITVLDNTLGLCQHFGFNTKDFLIAGSSALYVLGILETGLGDIPSDFDSLVRSGDKFVQLRCQFNSKLQHINGFHGQTVNIESGVENTLAFDLTREWPMHGVSTERLFGESIIVDAFNVMNPKYCLESMRQMGRDKDLRRLHTINAHTSNIWPEKII